MTKHANVDFNMIKKLIIERSNSEIKNKNAAEVSEILFDFGNNMNNLDFSTFEIGDDGISVEDLKKEMKSRYKGSDEQFEEGFDVFSQVFNHDDDNRIFSKKELEIFGLANGKDGDAFTFFRALGDGQINKLGEDADIINAYQTMIDNNEMTLEDALDAVGIFNGTNSTVYKILKENNTKEEEKSGYTEADIDKFATDIVLKASEGKSRSEFEEYLNNVANNQGMSEEDTEAFVSLSLSKYDEAVKTAEESANGANSADAEEATEKTEAEEPANGAKSADAEE